MFEVQKLYKEHVITMTTNGLESFKSALTAIGVDQRDYPEHQMMLLDYNQIECIKNHPVVNECRGLLIGYDGSIIRKGFDRFYNLGENGEETFDFENAIAFEKADGSLCMSEETILLTDYGSKTIKEICDDKFLGKVQAFNHTSKEVIFADIQGHLITENKDNWVEIELDDGRKLVVTENHKIWSESKQKYVAVSDLAVGELMLVL